LTATHGDSGDSHDEMHDEGIVGSEARDGSDAPAQPAALPGDFDNLPNDMSIFDYVPLDNVFRSPFRHVLVVPNSCINKWGIVFCRALTGLIKAADQPQHSRTNRTNLDHALKLYAVLPQIIFRNPGVVT
jgi:hypothetical protein